MFIRPDAPAFAHVPAKRIASAVWVVASQRVALLATLLVLLLLRHLIGQFAHPFAERFHGFGLIVERASEIFVPKCLFGLVHRLARAAEALTRRVAFGGTCAGQILRLTVQFVAQRALTIGEALFAVFAALTTGLLALTLLALLALPFAVLLATALVAGTALVLR